jgi:hypothetical protein
MRNFLLILSTSVLGPLLAVGQERFEEAPIRYSTSTPDNPISRLQEALDSGAVRLERDDRSGFLPDLLRQLGVPPESQVLVFSRTSLQQQFITPANPRAIYFNDDVYVARVPGSSLLELSVADPALGAVFYSGEPNAAGGLTITRRTETCLQCHAGTLTEGHPGHLVRSVFTDEKGFPILKAGSKVTTHDSPFEERWGGWYVTGTHGAARHRGNSIATETQYGVELDLDAGANLTALPTRVNANHYLTAHSDLVALMILEHQTQMHNLLTRATFETLMALSDQAVVDELLDRPAGTYSESTRRRVTNAGIRLADYMLFSTEARLDDPIEGSSGFAEHFAARGPRDSKGRSLRDLDLSSRIFRYPLSYLINSPQFAELPEPMKAFVLRRLWDILQGVIPQEGPKAFPLTPEQRQAILEIVADTVPGLPDYWKAATP